MSNVTVDAASVVVRVVIPARMQFLRVARLTVAGLASELGFHIREIEDLRVAVDELSAAMIEGAGPTAELELCYRVGEDHLEIEGRCRGEGGPPALHPVARELLLMTTDTFDLSNDAEGRSFRLAKRRGAPQA